MSRDVEAVIAALRIVLREAETRTSRHSWDPKVVNKWIAQLPGAWWGRWQRLRLRGDAFCNADRADVVAHVRATLAYLETRRDEIASRRFTCWRIAGRTVTPSGKPREIAPADKAPLVGKTQSDAQSRPPTRAKWLN